MNKRVRYVSWHDFNIFCPLLSHITEKASNNTQSQRPPGPKGVGIPHYLEEVTS